MQRLARDGVKGPLRAIELGMKLIPQPVVGEPTQIASRVSPDLDLDAVRRIRGRMDQWLSDNDPEATK